MNAAEGGEEKQPVLTIYEQTVASCLFSGTGSLFWLFCLM